MLGGTHPQENRLLTRTGTPGCRASGGLPPATPQHVRPGARHRLGVRVSALAGTFSKTHPAAPWAQAHTDLGPVSQLQLLADEQALGQQLPVPQRPLLPLLQGGPQREGQSAPRWTGLGADPGGRARDTAGQKPLPRAQPHSQNNGLTQGQGLGSAVRTPWHEGTLGAILSTADKQVNKIKVQQQVKQS